MAADGRTAGRPAGARAGRGHRPAGDLMIDQPRSPDLTVVGDAVPVVISVPADKTYVALIRSATAHLGARVGFSVVEITDLRLAVDEACGLLLSPHEHGGAAGRGGGLGCRPTEDGGGPRGGGSPPG